MKILIICSKKFYGNIASIKKQLEQMSHIVFLPNCYDAPETEEQFKQMSQKDHAEFKARMFKRSEETISQMDAVLVLNYDKDEQKNYIGGATFLEMYNAFNFKKKIYLLNDIPKNILEDEIIGFSPIILNGNLENIK